MKKFIIRDVEIPDKNFIFSSFLKGVYYGNELFQEIPKDIFFKNYQVILEKILSRPGIQIKVACLPEEQDVILGYCILEQEKLHWVFVKESWRKFGIAKDLVPQTTKECTHLTKVGRTLKRRFGLIFNPFIN